MQPIMAEWYRILSSLSATATAALGGVLDSTGGSVVSALLLGLVGSLSPCQLTTNTGALAYLSRRPRVARDAVAYVLGKAVVYTLLGVAALLVGRALAGVTIPMAVIARRVLGPAMLLAGLVLLGALRPGWLVGSRLAASLRGRAERGGPGSAFLLGAGFAVAFCPTMALLFFGLLVPLAIRAPLGVVYPAIFAAGTAIPLALMLAVVTAGLASARSSRDAALRLDRWVRVAAGILFVLAGLNDTLVYWLT